MENVFRKHFVSQLNKDLADATTLVWVMQNGLTESTMSPQELARCAHRLFERASVILGHATRWELLEPAEPTEPALLKSAAHEAPVPAA